MNDLYPEFDVIYSISDLHISVCGQRQIFFAGDLLAATIDNLRQNIEDDQRVALVINGDFIDFLALSDAKLFDREKAASKLLSIMEDEENRPIFEALAKFASDDRSNTLVIVVGNHDIELCLPTVQETLLQCLAGGDPIARGRIIIIDNGTGFRCQVGGCNILFMHGNETDSKNQIDHEGLRQVVYDLNHDLQYQNRVKPAIGTILVYRVLHKLKKSYPLIDLIKPEMEDNLPLLDAVIDNLPKHLKNLLSSFDHYLRDTITFPRLKPDYEYNVLGSENIPMRPLSIGVDGDTMLVDSFFRLQQDDDFDMDILDGLGDAVLSSHPIVDFLIQRIGPRLFTCYPKNRYYQQERAKRARQRLLDLRDEREAAQLLEGDDSIVSKIMDAPGIIGPAIHVLVAGHTHFRRIRPVSWNRFYCNTGSWIPTVILTPQVLENKNYFQRFLQIITQSDTSKALDELRREWPDDPPLVRDEPSMVRIKRIRRCGCSVELLDVTENGTFTPVPKTYKYEVQP